MEFLPPPAPKLGWGCWKTAAQAGKNIGFAMWQQLLGEAGARLDVQRCFPCPLGQTEALLGRAQPGARLALSSAQGKKVSPSVLRQVDIEGEMPK